MKSARKTSSVGDPPPSSRDGFISALLAAKVYPHREGLPPHVQLVKGAYPRFLLTAEEKPDIYISLNCFNSGKIDLILGVVELHHYQCCLSASNITDQFGIVRRGLQLSRKKGGETG